MNRLLHIIFFFLCLSSYGRAITEFSQMTVAATPHSKENSNIIFSYRSLGKCNNKNIYVANDIDLDGGKCEIPQGMTLVFQGGVIKNGILIGNNTKIKRNDAIFDHVIIRGSWIVPEISSDMFKDISRENVLKELFSLSNPDIKNTIIIEKGVYRVNPSNEWGCCLSVCSNTDLVINGTIKLNPNNFKGCDILRLEGDNIIIRGNGVIEGDKFNHLGTTGEWGMGINVNNSHHVKIGGLTIKNCWGDCIYIGDNSTDVLVRNCEIDNGRRQGVSITNANGVVVKDCKILNVGGTDPQYAIDVEPNANDTVDNIEIKRVEVINCKGGFLVYGKAKFAKIGKVQIEKCRLSVSEKTPVYFVNCDSAKLEKCQFYQNTSGVMIGCTEVDYVVIRNNLFFRDASSLDIKNIAKGLISNNINNYVRVNNCGLSVVENNKKKE